METSKKNQSTRRSFFNTLLSSSIGAFTGLGLLSTSSCKKKNMSDEEMTLLSPEGKLVKVNKSDTEDICNPLASRSQSRIGIPGKKFVLVVDLSKCKNARKCIEGCEKHHHLTSDRPYIKVLKMQDNEKSAPYWMPKKCFQCDNPPCVKVCPVGATYKRSDSIILIDNERCIGCRFCMAACPYSARVFNWGKPNIQDNDNTDYSPETSMPSKIGTVEKCDFCPDLLRQKKLPPCITDCPNGVLYFGDSIDDTVTNGDETVRLSELLRDKAGYRYMEELGTQPNVYYLPPVDRMFPFKENNDNPKS